MRKKNKLIHGFGINDADYEVYRKDWVDGVRKNVWTCPFYRKWTDMIARCYSRRYLDRRPTYKGCTVCDEWKYFSNFRAWMSEQNWEGRHLDKDLLLQGNKVYSPETCVLVHPKVNSFLVNTDNHTGPYKVGVYWSKAGNKFMAYIRNPFTNKRENLGLYETEDEGHSTWRERKNLYAYMLADSEYVDCDLTRYALRNRYL